MLKGISLGFVSSDDAGYGRAVAAIVIALVLVRLVLSPFVPLAYDEAYYWLWSKHPSDPKCRIAGSGRSSSRSSP